MRIDDDGWLASESGDPIVVRRTAGKSQSRRISAEQLVMHYAVTTNLEQTVAAQRARRYWATASIDGYRKGKRSHMAIVQALPFNVQGSHSRSFNHLGPGLEIANPGPLILEGGVLRTTYGQRWDKSDAIETGPVRGYPSRWTHWAKYSDEELAIAATVGLAMKQRADLFPDFRRIVGHHEIDPKRKFDPGPTDDDVSALDGAAVPVVFPIAWLRSMVFPELAAAESSG